MPSTFTDISTSEEKATEFKANAGQFNVDEALGIVECFVAGIGNKDSVGDVCLPGSFVGSLKRRKPRVVWGHNWNEPIGKVLDIYEVGPNDPRLPSKMRSAGIGGLYARVQFNLKSERGKEAFHSVVFFGEEQEWSIGYKTLDAVFDPSQQANLLKEVELYEVSPVLHGANQLTGTISIKADKPLKDPDGGLTAAGRAHFKRTEGANLKPGVKGPADTPEKMRRKGSFLTRFYSNPSGPLVDDDGEPTRLALAAAAWGEPVPKNRQDAAELAAKGRRMLDGYGKSKKKSANNGDYSSSSKSIYDSPEVASNTTMGRVAELTKALSARFSAPVKVRTADRDMVVFDVSNGGQSVTMRATYYFDGDEFMFGEPHQVRAETVYIPANSPSGAVAGHAFGHDHDDDNEGEYAHEYREMLRDVQKKPHGDCGCGCAGAGTCGTSPKPMTWGMFKERNPGAHLFIRAMGQEKSEAFDMVNEVCEYHGLDVKELDDGIAVPFIDSISEDGYNAIMTIAENMSDSFDAKSVGGKLRRIGRTAGNMMDRFDPNARDADGDRTVQEGTRFARPAKPDTPRMMPKVKPIQVPRPEEVPIKPPVPSTPTPAPTKVPDKPKVPQRARISGAMGRDRDRIPSRENVFEDLSPAQAGRLAPLDGNLGGRRPGQSPTGYENVLRDMISVDAEKPKKPKKKPSRLSGSMGLSDDSLNWRTRDFLNPESSELGKEMDKIIETADGDSAWDAWDELDNKLGGMLDDMSLGDLEDALDEMKAKFRQWGIGMQGEYNDALADRLMWGDEEGVIKHLMRWQDMTKRQAQKEAPRLIDAYEAASQKEQAFEQVIDALKSRIKEIEKEEDALSEDDFYD
jgi:HK97 family phage prohead protease